MAVSLVNGTTNNQVSSSTSLTIDKPTGADGNNVGDVLIAGITSDGTTPTPPSNWVEFGGGLHPSASWNVRLYYKIIDGTEGSTFTWTVGNVGPAAGFINGWRGVDNSDPIAAISSETGTTSSEPNTGPSLNTSPSDIGRLMYVRAVRESDEADSQPAYVAADLTTAATGVSRRASVGGVSGSGNTAYTIGHFSNNSNYSVATTYSGIAISCNRSEDHNYEITYALRANNTGSLSSTLPKVSSSLVGERHEPSGSVAATLPSVTSEFNGNHHVPSDGSISATLPSVTSSLEGYSEASGVLTASIVITTQLQTETRQFGEHVILVEPDHRAFLVVDDGTDVGLKNIKRSQVTDA